MPYTINNFRGTLISTVPDNSIQTGTIPISLVGRNSSNYGTAIAENMVYLLENFASSTGPGSTSLQGQLWYDTANNVLKVNSSATSTPNWTIVGSVSADGTGSAEGVIASIPVLISLSNGKIIAITCDQTIAFGSLPATITLNGVSYTLSARFPSGLAPGVNLATDANSYKFVGTAVSALYGDIAERYETSEAVEPGDLVEIGGPKEIQKTSSYGTTNVFGVVSTNPAVEMNANAGDDLTHPFIALSGRVPVKVIGQVNKGQRIVASSIAGVGIAINDSDITSSFMVIGRALSTKTTTTIDLLEVSIGAK